MSLTREQKTAIRLKICDLLDKQCDRCGKKEEFPGNRMEKERQLLAYCQSKCPVGHRMNEINTALLLGRNIDFDSMEPVEAPVLKRVTEKRYGNHQKRYHIYCTDCDHRMVRVKREEGFGNCVRCGGKMEYRGRQVGMRGRPPKEKKKTLV